MFLGPRALGGASADLLRAQAGRALRAVRTGWSGLGPVVQGEEGRP